MTDDEDSRLRANQPLARKAARAAFHRWGVAYDDAYADALLGLWEAEKTSDPARGLSFKRWAAARMSWKILDGYRSDSPIPRTGPRPILIDIDSPAVSAHDTRSFADILPDPRDSLTAWWDDQERVDRERRDEQLLAELHEATLSLKERDQQIIRGHMNGETLFDLAAAAGVTESRACQIWRAWLGGLGLDGTWHSGSHSRGSRGAA